MEVDWSCQQNATGIYSKSSHALDPRRKQEAGTTKRDVEKVRGARDEGSRVELGLVRKAGSGQTTMAFLGVGLMCEHTRRGLSKYSVTTSQTRQRPTREESTEVIGRLDDGLVTGDVCHRTQSVEHLRSADTWHTVHREHRRPLLGQQVYQVLVLRRVQEAKQRVVDA